MFTWWTSWSPSEHCNILLETNSIPKCHITFHHFFSRIQEVTFAQVLFETKIGQWLLYTLGILSCDPWSLLTVQIKGSLKPCMNVTSFALYELSCLPISREQTTIHISYLQSIWPWLLHWYVYYFGLTLSIDQIIDIIGAWPLYSDIR